MKGARSAAALVACLSTTGCSGDPSTDGAGVARAPIVYGEPSPASEDGVLLLRTSVDGHELLCSSALVAENLVLTARHCVSYLVEGPFNCTVRGELIDNPTGAGVLGLHLPPGSIEFHGARTPRGEPLARGTKVLSTLSANICVNDLAFVVLDTAVDLPVLPIRLGRPARTGEITTLVGYGLDEHLAERIDYRTQPRLHKTGLEIAGVGPDTLDEGVTTIPPRTIVLDGPSGCIADSGGPLLAAETGAILGVYSALQGGTCIDEDVRQSVTHLPALRALADDAFAAAGAEPLLEPPPGASCDGACPGARDSGADSAGDAHDAGESTPARRRDEGCAAARPGSRPAPAAIAAIVWAMAAARTRAARKRAG